MSPCKHTKLLVITATADRLRCRQCHLVIKAADVADGYCPECYETTGRKNNDFEEVATPAGQTVRYRCEECGALLNPRNG